MSFGKRSENDYLIETPSLKRVKPNDPLGLAEIDPKDDKMIATAKLNPKDPLGLNKCHYPKKSQNNKNNTLKNDKHEGKKEKKVFRYGNYSQYYGYRCQENKLDPRVELIDPELIRNRRVLDIGCNTGQFTLLLATKCQPKFVIGIDIDDKLIQIANTNKKYYSAYGILTSLFPISFAQTFGPLPPVEFDQTSKTHFQHANFLDFKLENESFDTILALSITKWIHLNWGDEGLLKFFKKCRDALVPNGVLILEFQPYSSYRKKRNIHPEIKQNYDKIKIRPDQFSDILIKELKFSKIVEIDKKEYQTQNKFDRPFYLVYK